MNLFRVVANVLTVGGHGRLQQAKEKYSQLSLQYQSLYEQAKLLEGGIEEDIALLGNDTKTAFTTLKRAHVLTKQNRHHFITAYSSNIDYTKISSQLPINTLFSSYSSTIEIAKGAGIGSAAVVGSWSLVSLVGVASTGTPIATLSGAAATNATLAWFGGGALAAGGAGMAGGFSVLCGIVAVPLAVFAVSSIYHKAAEIEGEIPKLEAATKKVRENIDELEEIRKSLNAASTRLKEAHIRLSDRLKEVKRTLFPLGILSRLWRYLCEIFGKPYYSEYEYKFIVGLQQEVESFSSLFKVIETGGSIHGIHEESPLALTGN